MLWTRVRGITTPSAIGSSVHNIDRRDGQDLSLNADIALRWLRLRTGRFGRFSRRALARSGGSSLWGRSKPARSHASKDRGISPVSEPTLQLAALAARGAAAA